MIEYSSSNAFVLFSYYHIHAAFSIQFKSDNEMNTHFSTINCIFKLTEC